MKEQDKKVVSRRKALALMGVTLLAACTPLPTTEPTPTRKPTLTPKPSATAVPATATLNPSPVPSATKTEVPTATNEPGVVIEAGLRFEIQEEGDLVNMFPGSEVYKAERGDVVIINKETGLELAGQEIQTKYGNLTVLVAPQYYQWKIDHLLSEDLLQDAETLADYPDWYRQDPDLAEPTRQRILNLQNLQAYKKGEDSQSGYPEMSTNVRKDEIMRIIGILIDLEEKRVRIDAIDLATYKPQRHNLVAVYSLPGNAARIANSLPEGTLDPEKDFISLTSADLSSKAVQTASGDYVSVHLSSWYNEKLRNLEDTVFIVYVGEVLRAPMYSIQREAFYAQGLRTDPTNPDLRQYSKPFEKLYSNYDSLSEFWTEPATTKEEILRRGNVARYHVDEIVEVDMEKFR